MKKTCLIIIFLIVSLGFVFEPLLCISAEKKKPVQKVNKPAVLLSQETKSLETTYHALIIGNNQYRYLRPLKTAKNDAVDVEKLLAEKFKFKTKLLLDATREQIVDQLNEFREKLQKKDSLLIYYAGHGEYVKDLDTAFWLPIDAQENKLTRWISHDDIITNIKLIAARHILVISDSCYSGTLAREAITELITGDRGGYIRKLLDRTSRTLMASGGNEQVSDSGGGNNSVFAAAFLKALEESEEKIFLAEDIFRSWIRPIVAGKSKQMPVYRSFRNSGDEGGDFVFQLAKLGVEATKPEEAKNEEANQIQKERQQLLEEQARIKAEQKKVEEQIELDKTRAKVAEERAKLEAKKKEAEERKKLTEEQKHQKAERLKEEKERQQVEAKKKQEEERQRQEAEKQRIEEEKVKKTEKAAWGAKLKNMKTAFKKAEELEKKKMAPDLKITAWQRFLDTYQEKNPYSDEDTRLREKAGERINHWQNEKKGLDEARVELEAKKKEAEERKKQVEEQKRQEVERLKVEKEQKQIEAQKKREEERQRLEAEKKRIEEERKTKESVAKPSRPSIELSEPSSLKKKTRQKVPPITSPRTETSARLALVIGNSAYQFSPLKNPVNDASDLASALKDLGFTVTLMENADLRAMEEALVNFGNRLKKGGVGLFFYAGHGVQVQSTNYLIPINARVHRESDVQFEALNVGKVLNEMAEANNGLNIVILDACRDNPFKRKFRSVSNGLAVISQAPLGTFISYSTGPGKVALDGNERNSPYTKALLETIKQPGLRIEEVFKGVRQKISSATGGNQVPWEFSSLQGEFYFNPVSRVDVASNEPASSPNSAKSKDGKQIARLDVQSLTPSKPPSETSSPSTYTDSVTGIEMVLVKGGCYQMGDIFGDGASDEKPVHEVCLDDFYLGKYEVTQGQWTAIMGSNPAYFRNGDNYPVENVSLHDAQEFIRKLNQKTEKNYRLPTEAEWEYAARSGGKKEKWAGTSNESELVAYAWYADNSGGKTHPVGEKRPNGLGLYDMSGNVWEWCKDTYNSNAYQQHSRNNPICTRPGANRVVRGGAWSNSPMVVRAGVRIYDSPVDRYDFLGFRLAESK